MSFATFDLIRDDNLPKILDYNLGGCKRNENKKKAHNIFEFYGNVSIAQRLFVHLVIHRVVKMPQSLLFFFLSNIQSYSFSSFNSS